MTTQEIANRYSVLSKEAKWAQIQDELFAADAASIEPEGMPGLQTVHGLDAIKKKGEAFNSAVEEIYGGWCSEPVVGGRFFSVAMGIDVKMKGSERMNMDEIVLYEVKDGKIVREQFFF